MGNNFSFTIKDFHEWYFKESECQFIPCLLGRMIFSVQDPQHTFNNDILKIILCLCKWMILPLQNPPQQNYHL